MNINEISGIVVDSALRVHSVLGAGLLEHIYQVCLKHELTGRGLKALSEVSLPVVYDGITIDVGYRLDLVVEDELIVEVKSVTQLTALHRAQMLTYLKLTKKPLGLLINFNTPHLREGIIRLIYSSPSASFVSSAV